jgi:hypothetical protein
MRLRCLPISYALLVLALAVGINVQGAGEQMTVYKVATCGCCKKWVEYMKQNGFQVTAHDVPSTAPYRQKYGVPDVMQSCHTAVVGKYAVEGHVPAQEIKRILQERRAAKALAVPGMPLGSPGMEAVSNPSRRDAYSVILVDPSGRTSVYRAYSAVQ